MRKTVIEFRFSLFLLLLLCSGNSNPFLAGDNFSGLIQISIDLLGKLKQVKRHYLNEQYIDESNHSLNHAFNLVFLFIWLSFFVYCVEKETLVVAISFSSKTIFTIV